MHCCSVRDVCDVITTKFYSTFDILKNEFQQSIMHEWKDCSFSDAATAGVKKLGYLYFVLGYCAWKVTKVTPGE